MGTIGIPKYLASLVILFKPRIESIVCHMEQVVFGELKNQGFTNANMLWKPLLILI